MIPNEENEKEGWHHLAVKKLSALLCRKTSNHNGNFCCLNCLHSFKMENKLKSHEKTFKEKGFSSTEMPSEGNKILKLSQQTKLEKMPYTIYVDIQCLV